MAKRQKRLNKKPPLDPVDVVRVLDSMKTGTISEWCDKVFLEFMWGSSYKFREIIYTTVKGQTLKCPRGDKFYQVSSRGQYWCEQLLEKKFRHQYLFQYNPDKLSFEKPPVNHYSTLMKRHAEKLGLASAAVIPSIKTYWAMDMGLDYRDAKQLLQARNSVEHLESRQKALFRSRRVQGNRLMDTYSPIRKSRVYYNLMGTPIKGEPINIEYLKSKRKTWKYKETIPASQ